MALPFLWYSWALIIIILRFGSLECWVSNAALLEENLIDVLWNVLVLFSLHQNLFRLVMFAWPFFLIYIDFIVFIVSIRNPYAHNYSK